MAKLYVPGPDDDEEPLDPLFLGGIVCLGLAFAVLVWFSHFQSPVEPSVPTWVAAVHADPLRAQRELAERLGVLDDEALRTRAWTDQEVEAAARFGPRAASEAACEAVAAGAELRIAPQLAPLLRARSMYAPWTCLSRLLLRDALPEGEVHREVAGFWEELALFEGDVAIVGSILDGMGASGALPEEEDFWSWVRICAIHPSYAGAPACQRLLAEVAPEQGADLVLMVDRHLQRASSAEADLPVIIAGLGELARRGQPAAWRVVATEALPDYDADLRLAATFTLCRFVHAPDDRVASAAARQLASTARVGGRGVEAHLLPRWRETCRLAFGGGKGREPHAPVPKLAVWSGVAGDAPDFTLAGAVARGACELRPGHPAWWCGAAAWAGQEGVLATALSDLFVHTRYMEWEDDPL